jgi:hypothetical protein
LISNRCVGFLGRCLRQDQQKRVNLRLILDTGRRR